MSFAAVPRRPLWIPSALCVLVVSLCVSATACGTEEGDGDGVGDDDGGGDSGVGDVPSDPSYCAAVVDWEPAAAQLEQDVLTIVNQRRAEGADCGSAGVFDPALPLTMNGRLRCAARNHTVDMVARSYLEHNSPEGTTPSDRVDEAGYVWVALGENIAGGSADAEGTMEQWMGSDGHCGNIMNPAYTELGAGYVEGGQYGHTWTQVFGDSP